MPEERMSKQFGPNGRAKWEAVRELSLYRNRNFMILLSEGQQRSCPGNAHPRAASFVSGLGRRNHLIWRKTYSAVTPQWSPWELCSPVVPCNCCSDCNCVCRSDKSAAIAVGSAAVVGLVVVPLVVVVLVVVPLVVVPLEVVPLVVVPLVVVPLVIPRLVSTASSMLLSVVQSVCNAVVTVWSVANSVLVLVVEPDVVEPDVVVVVDPVVVPDVVVPDVVVPLVVEVVEPVVAPFSALSIAVKSCTAVCSRCPACSSASNAAWLRPGASAGPGKSSPCVFELPSILLSVTVPPEPLLLASAYVLMAPSKFWPYWPFWSPDSPEVAANVLLE